MIHQSTSFYCTTVNLNNITCNVTWNTRSIVITKLQRGKKQEQKIYPRLNSVRRYIHKLNIPVLNFKVVTSREHYDRIDRYNNRNLEYHLVQTFVHRMRTGRYKIVVSVLGSVSKIGRCDEQFMIYA